MSIEDRIKRLEAESRTTGGKGYNIEPLFLPLLDKDGNWDPKCPFPKERVEESTEILRQNNIIISRKGEPIKWI